MKSTKNKTREPKERKARAKSSVIPEGMMLLSKAAAELGLTVSRIKNNKELSAYLEHRIILGKGYVDTLKVAMFQAMTEGLVSHKEAALRLGMSGRTLHDHKRIKKLIAEQRIMGWAYYSAEKIEHYRELFCK